MNCEVIKIGMVVKSMAGHDSGSFYAVMRVENGMAYIADGKRRKTDAPKRKIRFICKKPTRLSILRI